MRKKKIIQVPMSEDLVQELDTLSRRDDRSRASVIREAAVEYITRREEEEKERQYIEGLEKHGEAVDEDEAKAWFKLQMEALEPEDFSDWEK